jgi:hypothetical protein
VLKVKIYLILVHKLYICTLFENTQAIPSTMSNKKQSSKKKLSESNKDNELDDWFSTLIENIKTDHFLLKENIASKETKQFYQTFMSGDETSILAQVRGLSSIGFIKNLIVDYLKEVKSFKKLPLKLAFGLSDSKILVWSEINDNDDATEDALLLAESRVNNKYHSRGFYINSTIIEKSDNLAIPPHYQTISIPTIKN